MFYEFKIRVITWQDFFVWLPEKDKDVKVETKKIRNNVYEITVTAPAGEYCIMPVINGIGGYAGVFDFTIEWCKFSANRFL